MSLVRSPRSPLLRPFVAVLGHYDGAPPPGRELVLPSASTALIINLAEDELRTYDGPAPGARVHKIAGAAFDGPSSTARVIDTMEQTCTISVSFAPGGLWPFSPIPPTAMVDDLVELPETWGHAGRIARERVLEAADPAARLDMVESVLLDHLDRRAAPSPALDHAAALLQRDVPVAAVADRLGWLPGTFTRRFRDRVGLTPKRYSRVRRLQRVLSSVARATDRATNRSADWAELAVTHGYYDQAHLINDFRDLTGLTPTAYRPRTPTERNHVPLIA